MGFIDSIKSQLFIIIQILASVKTNIYDYKF